MAKVKCKRCGGMLVKDIERTAGEVLEVIKCIMCGNRVASRQVQRGTEDKMEKKVDKPQVMEPQVMDADKQADAAGLPPDAAETVPQKPQPVKTEPAKKRKRQKNPVRECADCGKPRTIVGRGLCGTCYAKNKKAGTLDNYPSRVQGGALVKKPAVVEKPGELCAVNVEVAPDNPNLQLVPLTFDLEDPRDAELYKKLSDAAAVDRRTMAAEIMTLLETVTSDE